jgi:hypothetical protein
MRRITAVSRGDAGDAEENTGESFIFSPLRALREPRVRISENDAKSFFTSAAFFKML